MFTYNIMTYVLRLQAHDGYSNKFNDVFSDERFFKILCVPHTGRKGDNPHYHFCISCDYKKQALRAHLKKHFNLGSGNRHISLKDWDGHSKALSYMFKEGTDPVFNRGYSDEDVKGFKELNASIQEVIKNNSPTTIVQECIEHFKDQPDKVGEFAVFKWLMYRLKENGDWIPNKFQMERWILRVQTGVLDGKDYDQWLDHKFQEWFRR